MKTSRRKFIGLGTAALSALPLFKSLASKTARPVTKPIVVSTWNFGIEANKEAWKILSSNGRALDAIVP